MSIIDSSMHGPERPAPDLATIEVTDLHDDESLLDACIEYYREGNI